MYITCVRRKNTFMCRRHTLVYFWGKWTLRIQRIGIFLITIETIVLPLERVIMKENRIEDFMKAIDNRKHYKGV